MQQFANRSENEGIIIIPGPPSTCEIDPEFNDNVILNSEIIRGRMVRVLLPDAAGNTMDRIYLSVDGKPVLCDFVPAVYRMGSAREELNSAPVRLSGKYVLTPSMSIGNKIKWVIAPDNSDNISQF